MSQYPVPPPTYGSAGTTPKPNNNYFNEHNAQEPLLGSSSRNGFYDQPAQGDVPDDFKVFQRSAPCPKPHINLAILCSMG